MKRKCSLLLAILFCLTLLPFSSLPAQGAGETEKTLDFQNQRTVTENYFVMENGDLYHGNSLAYEGQLTEGSNTYTGQCQFEKVEGISNVIHVAESLNQTLAVTADGSLYTWGKNDNGQLGLGDTVDRDTPQKVEGISPVISADISETHGIAVTENGSVYVWGSVYMGDDAKWNQIWEKYTSPHKVEGVPAGLQVSTGGGNFTLVTQNGDLYTWGVGQNGYAEGLPQYSPVPTKILSNVKMAVSRKWSSYAITNNGTLYGWGENWDSSLGLSGGKVWEPTRIMTHVSRVSMDWYKSAIAITESGELYIWGFYGDRPYENHEMDEWSFSIPEKVDCGDTAVADVVAQGTDTLILTQDGGLYLWNIGPVYDVGWDLKQVTTGVMVPEQLQREPKPPEEPGNRPLDQKGIFDAEYFVDPAGDLYSFGDGTAKQVTTPGKVAYCDDDLIITRDGSLYLWEGQWVKKEGLPPVLKADRWEENGIAITMSGVYVWGNVYTGDDANWNPIIEKWDTPQNINWSAADVACGPNVFALVTAKGKLYTWGMGPMGETGYGEGNPKNSAEPRWILSDVLTVQCNEYTCQALTEDGDLYVWGGNFEHRSLGMDDFYVMEPTRLMRNVQQADLDRFSGAALTQDGQLYLWGYYQGKDNDPQEEQYRLPEPTLVDTGDLRFAELAYGGTRSALLATDGTLWQWNIDGVTKNQLGKQCLTKVAEEIKMLGAACGSMDNFVQERTYQQGQFSDVDENAWYGANQQGTIQGAYELGLMDGMGDGTFAPGEHLSCSEAIKMASVVRSIYTDDGVDLTGGEPWDAPYRAYSVLEGIIPFEMKSEFYWRCSRSQMAYLFARALPEEELEPVEGAILPPDVSDDQTYAKEIRLLYQAGILQGSDAEGNFHPGDWITRAEATAILNRLCQKDARIGA